MLAEMIDYIRERNYDIHSETVIRNSYLVADAPIYPIEQGLKMDTKGVELLESAIRDATQAVDDPEPVEGGFSVG
jgi:hypothetical protein